MKQAEFDGIRSWHYEKAIMENPEARRMDKIAMHELLDPQQGERILGFGEGNGYFARDIAEAVGSKGYYLVTDPSADQLENLRNRMGRLSQVEVKVIGAEGLEIPDESFDKVWSFGAFRHVPNQTEAMKIIYGALRQVGKAVICDVFQGSSLSKHFDSQVARYCITGHEVKFMSEDFARTLCYLAGFDDDRVEIKDLPQKWVFDTEEDLGRFIYDIHAMTKLDGSEEEKLSKVILGCREILGIRYNHTRYELNWPMKSLTVIK